MPAGGTRSADQGARELLTAANGPAAIVQSRDGVRQTVVDMMQIVREIQAGIDERSGSRQYAARA